MKCIQLNKGQVAIVDDEDFAELAQWRWHVDPLGYVSHSINYQRPDGSRTCRTVKMHRAIMNPLPGFLVDHKNGNKLDNRKCNLRIATVAQNNANSKAHADKKVPVKGVTFDPRCKTKPYRARIKLHGKLKDLGHYPTMEEANAAYFNAAKAAWGEFARMN